MSNSITQPSVTFCINELDVGGAEKALVRIALGLHERHWQVRVISLRDKGPLADDLEAQGIAVKALGGGGFADFSRLPALKAALRHEFAADVIVSFLHQANIHTRLAARNIGVPVVSGIRVADRRRWVTWTDRLTSRWVQTYVAVSQSVADVHARLCGLDAQRIVAIPNGVDLPAEDVLSFERPSGKLLCVGRLTPQKAPLDAIEAFRRLPQRLRQDASLILVGEGELRQQLQHTIDHAGLRDQIQLAGQVTDVAERMQRATALVLASHWEGMPNVVLEAMANGLPVVATAVDGTAELIEARTSGWLVNAGQPGALADAITECLEQPDLRQKYAENAYQAAQTRFSWTSVVSRYERLLRSILTRTDAPFRDEM